MPKQATRWQQRKWEDRLIHINQRASGVPEGTLEWYKERFAKAADVQRMLGMHNSLKPEIDTALEVMRRLDKAGVHVRQPKKAR